jgi:hypothetical protein
VASAHPKTQRLRSQKFGANASLCERIIERIKELVRD